MQPRQIERMVHAQVAYEKARELVHTIREEIDDPLLSKATSLQERYTADGLTAEQFEGIGQGLKSRLDTLLQALWDTEDNPRIGSIEEHVQLDRRLIEPDGDIAFWLYRYKNDDYVATGAMGLMDEGENNWGLHINKYWGSAALPRLDNATMHAYLLDDIDSVSGIMGALGIEIPADQPVLQPE